MQRHIGVLAAEPLAVGLVEDAKVVGLLRIYPSERTQAQIQVMPAADIGNTIRAEVEMVGRGEAVRAIGVGFPGIIRDGVVEDSPNLQRAMRLRVLDMEPEEIFDTAKKGDSRSAQFVTRWHRALAAATATSIHLEGPGKFFVTGPNARFIDANLLDNFLHEMVKMSPLQGSLFAVIATGDEIGIIGAAVNAARHAAR